MSEVKVYENGSLAAGYIGHDGAWKLIVEDEAATQLEQYRASITDENGDVPTPEYAPPEAVAKFWPPAADIHEQGRLVVSQVWEREFTD